MRARGIAVSIASDNTGAPFYAYGDLDGLKVFTPAVRSAHLDHPIGDWSAAVTGLIWTQTDLRPHQPQLRVAEYLFPRHLRSDDAQGIDFFKELQFDPARVA